MELKKIVLHHIDKELKEKATLNCSTKLIIINDTVTEFVEKLIKVYGAKNPSQGTFEDDEVNFPFQTKARKYIEDDDFLKLTIESMDILKSKMDINTTTGGYVIFIHYVQNQIDFLITAMMDKSAHYTNTNDLGIEKLMALDIEKMARANRLNFEKWKNKEGRYLTFIKGTRTVSQYFIKFIGATDISSAKENFDKLKDAVKKYSVAANLPMAKQSKIREDISEYVEKCFVQKRDVEIESIAAIIDSEEPTAFLGFIEDNEIEISGAIGVHSRSDFYSFTRNSIKEDGYHLVFEKELIKKEKITRDGNSIIIHDVPEEKLNSMFEDTQTN